MGTTVLKVALNAKGPRILETTLRSVTCRIGSLIGTVAARTNVGLGRVEISKKPAGGGFLVRFRTSYLHMPVGYSSIRRTSTLKTIIVGKVTHGV